VVCFWSATDDHVGPMLLQRATVSACYKVNFMRRAAWLDSLLLLLLASILIWPLFGLEYLNNWTSIESTFIADARLLSHRLPHPGWQPLWYCGTRFDYIYPPALRYGTALISRFGGVSTARSYHLYTAILYLLGIVAVYWLARVGNGWRPGALLAAAGAALLSPSFLMLPVIRHDSFYRVPQRLHVLMAYGEGPHISALCVLPAALALSLLALRQWRPLALSAAGVLCAFTVANNFYGATALAILFPIAAWSVWVGQPERSVWWRAAGIAVLAYVLSAFWLTPSFLRITTTNLKWVSAPGNGWSRLITLLVAAVFCGITWRWGNRRPERSWTIFLGGAVLFLGLLVLGVFYFRFRVVGEAHRLIPEFDLALVLAFVEVIRTVWKHPRLRLVAIVAVIVAFSPAIRYLRHAYTPFPKAGPLENQYQYSITKWVNDHLPGERILPVGSVRFWFNAWFDNPQVDGGSSQGMLNQVLPVALWQLAAGTRGDLAVLWLRALGADAAIVPGPASLEPYHDYQKPEKFRALAPVLYDDQHGTTIYRIPRPYPGIGRTIRTADLDTVGKLQGGDDANTLTRYVSVIDSPGQSPTRVNWKSFDQLQVQAQTSRGQSILLQETYDPAWRAYENGKPLDIRAEPLMNFMLIGVAEGNHTIQLRFTTPFENRAGQVIFFFGLAALAALVYLDRKHRYGKASSNSSISAGET